MKVFQVQYNSEDEFTWLVDYLYQLKFDITEGDSFSVFKVDNRISVQEFKKSISQQLDQDNSKGGSLSIKFRGEKLDHHSPSLSSQYFTQMFQSRSTCVIVKSQNKQPFELDPYMLGLQERPEICEYCDEKHVLKFACGCNTIFYCSIKCRVKNMGLHIKFCELAFNINHLLEMQEPPQFVDSLNTELGLANMGNSCYLSSVFQVIRLYKPFYEYIQKLDYFKMLELNKTQLNIFPYLKDAFGRMNFTSMDTYSPYLLKAVIGIKDSNVGSD